MSSEIRAAPAAVIDYARPSSRRRPDRLNLVVGVVLWVVLAAVVGAYAVGLKHLIDR